MAATQRNSSPKKRNSVALSVSPRGGGNCSTSSLLKEADMRKLITAAVALLAIGLWLLPVSAVAQGRGLGRPDGAPGGSGSHAPLGAPGADVDKGHGSAHDA